MSVLSKLSRRNFFGAAAGAAAAAPDMAKQMASAGVSAFEGRRLLGGNLNPTPPPADDAGIMNRIVQAQNALTDFRRAGRAEERQRLQREQSFRPLRLDADLVSLRSFSLSARMAIQRERDIERQLDDREANMAGWIKSLMKNAGL